MRSKKIVFFFPAFSSQEAAAPLGILAVSNIFSPSPGAPVMERAFELGIQVPKTFEEWSDFFPRYQVLPWMNGKKHERLQTMREYLRMAFNRVPVSIHRKDRFTRTAHELLALPARW